MPGYTHIYIHIDECLPAYKPIYMHAAYMYVCMHTYMGNLCMPNTVRQILMLVCLHTFIHTNNSYISAWSRYNFRIKYFHSFRKSIFFPKLQKFHTSDNMIISTFLNDNYLLLLFVYIGLFYTTILYTSPLVILATSLAKSAQDPWTYLSY